MNLMAINQATTLTMSSREIAELTGKQHKDVLYDIRKMLAEIQSAEKSADYQDGRNRTQTMLILDKRETLCLVSGYNVKMRMAIIDRWQQLEEQKQATSPMAVAATMNSAQLGLLMQEVAAKEEAIRTKAQIGSKREATCMARVAHSKREAAAAKADEAPKSLADMLEEAAALIRQKDQQIRDRALRGVMMTPKRRRKSPDHKGRECQIIGNRVAC